jgi:hypothetical protein
VRRTRIEVVVIMDWPSLGNEPERLDDQRDASLVLFLSLSVGKSWRPLGGDLLLESPIPHVRLCAPQSATSRSSHPTGGLPSRSRPKEHLHHLGTIRGRKAHWAAGPAGASLGVVAEIPASSRSVLKFAVGSREPSQPDK